MKCNHCQITDRICPGERNPRICDLTNSEHPLYRPGYDKVVMGSKGPGVLAKIKTAAVAAAGFVASGFALASPEVRTQRRDICSACPFNENGKCLKCGCIISVKIQVANESCPEGKWAKVEPLEFIPAKPCGCGSQNTIEETKNV